MRARHLAWLREHYTAYLHWAGATRIERLSLFTWWLLASAFYRKRL